MMDAERWQQIDRVLQAAQELEGDERRRFLDVACAKDEELRREVDSLLAQESGDFSLGAMEIVARQMAGELAKRETATVNDSLLPNSAPTLIANLQNGIQPSLRFAPGELLNDRYLIERELGRGGIGVVFLAQDQKLYGMQVVIKVLLEQWMKSDHRLWFERKFQDELKALALINHHGVVPVHDVGQLPDGRSFLVMKYVPGEPLSESISPGGIALKRAANLIHQIAHALTAAHDKGVIHRDLKPANILLQTVDGEEKIKLIDFGIATVRDAISTASPTTKTLAGTPRYMAPEQLQGKPEKASDIYALGVIAYQLVTGEFPFNGKSPTEIAAEQRAGIKALPRDLRPDLPEAAGTAILKALAIDLADRYQDARDFGNQFRQTIEAVDPYQTNVGVLPQEEESAQPVPDAPHTQRIPSRRRFLIPAAAMLAVSILAGVLAWRGQQFSNQPVPSAAPGKSATALPAAPERALSHALSFQNPRRQVTGRPDEIIFQAGDKARLDLSSFQTGHLYVLNEGPSQVEVQPAFVLLFPTPFTNGGLSEIAANQVIPVPLFFDQEMGVEKLWLIWAEHPVPELEAIKRHVNQREQGAITDRAEIAAIKQFLDAHPTATIEQVAANQPPKFKQQGDVLIGLLQMKHY